FAPVRGDVLQTSTQTGALSARAALMDTAQDILRAGWEQSTIRTYSRALSVHVHGFEQQVDSNILPLDSPDKLMLLFASMDGMAWQTMRLNKAAVRAWHQSNNYSQAINLRAQDVHCKASCACCFIKKQKNDPCGKGQWCFIPFKVIAGLSPAKLLQDWMDWKAATAAH
ncbi:unnamed protein product, partial [Prorocentrum cordatum]